MDMCFGHQMPWLGQSVGIPASRGEEKGFSCLVIKMEKDISHQREEHLDLTAPSPVSQPAVHLHCKFSGQEVVQLVFPVFWYFTPTDPPPTRAFKLPPNCLWEIPSDFSPLSHLKAAAPKCTNPTNEEIMDWVCASLMTLLLIR